ncbi:Fis family transcriptional regulator [Sphingobium jiangsuense]|uniref:Transcriptional regulator with PAS, ATPase and Fis domain n=2 Tax=Sphingobium jiangsuense TaxID=870476 RepID=A0A7W6FPN1_9SPHN|nr:sigma 54-interacting transcriptional regulator [Sphingobium jiangsuense]MBB3926053.1 transcriptional regulator with PAS, ATPase and Fis domain [Sphingobium jiangsuense]GLT00560.1 Fis family transcriptional regulator [Sphingobium jiangsuense]
MAVSRKREEMERKPLDLARTVLSLDPDDTAIPAIRARAFVFSDPRSRALVPLVERAAPSDATVLVIGETGTGKELVARYVHALSDRSKGPFVAVNCGAFSETMIEAELFGHERGAFTGATESRAGWFEAANGGTLFLDEIGDLPLGLQVKLLRVLQEREVVRVGARKPIPLDVRLIAATNIDLAKAVSAGRFREDLFYRLQVVPIPILPLRERRADILPLARHFLELYGSRMSAARLDLSPAAEEALFAYGWPGNIRELENAIHRATLTCHDGLIEPADLALGPLGLTGGGLAAASVGRGDGPGEAAGAPGLEEELAAVMNRLLAEGHDALLDRTVEHLVRLAYQRHNGNQIRTAAALGITRNVLRTYLKNFGML